MSMSECVPIEAMNGEDADGLDFSCSTSPTVPERIHTRQRGLCPDRARRYRNFLVSKLQLELMIEGRWAGDCHGLSELNETYTTTQLDLGDARCKGIR